MRIAVTGANGQLGQSLNKVKDLYPSIHLDFYTKEDWDISNQLDGLNILRKGYDALINCAAYTAVDKAESDDELCFRINDIAVRQVAEMCQDFDTHMIHISTDYVYHNRKRRPLKEKDYCCPQGVYALSKLRGEESIRETCAQHTIIRTSWVYSEFEHNFVKSILRLGKEKGALKIVSDQHGAPTYAPDLAKACLEVAQQFQETKDLSGTYNFSNEGWTTWYEFAKEIFKISNLQIPCRPIPSTQYPTPAKRPSFSVMSLNKIRPILKTPILNWRSGLQTCLKELGRLS